MSSGHQRIKWHRNIAENFNRLSRVHERYRQTTDRRQTTDGQTTTYSEHEHEFTFAKKLYHQKMLDGYQLKYVRRSVILLGPIGQGAQLNLMHKLFAIFSVVWYVQNF